nr:lytic transglycosylase domain-containing protein [Azospirillum sp. SYSU D00513]
MCNRPTRRKYEGAGLKVGSTVRRVKSLLGAVALSALVASCAGDAPQTTAGSGNFDQHIAEASARFNMPEHWIREVIRQESGGRTMMNGRPIVSHAGAMGLMQVMPGTYAEMRRKHGLGPDPFHPRDNILAGTAYLREMYDLFGAPGFLGAYNCGPGCYGDYLAGRRTLPGETRRYLASVGPRLNGAAPAPGGYDTGIVAVAAVDPVPRSAVQPPSAQTVTRAPVQVAELPPPAVAPPYVPPRPSVAPGPVVARPAPVPAAPVQVAGQWTIQLGAFRSPDDGSRVIDRARRTLPTLLDRASRVVQPVSTEDGTLYRARLTGLSQKSAADSCASLAGLGMACFVVPPSA